MSIEFDNNHKIAYLSKIVFSNITNLKESVSLLKENVSSDYKFIILERGEAIAACFELYSIFKNKLHELDLNNPIYILTETEVIDYYDFIKNTFGWECVFVSAFYDSPRIYEKLYNLNFQSSVHIHNWQDIYKIPFDKNIEKYFLTLNRSYRNESHWHRVQLYSFMKDANLFDKSHASFRFLPEFDNNFGEQIEHIDDINNNHDLYTQINLKRLYESSFVSILTESNYDDTIKVRMIDGRESSMDVHFEFRNDYLTEKTSRNMALGIPFIMVGPYKSLDRLKNMGFKTFNEFIDEAYDDEADKNKRFEMIKKEILRLSNLSKEEMESIHKKLYTTLVHNQSNIKNIRDSNARKIQNLLN